MSQELLRQNPIDQVFYFSLVAGANNFVGQFHAFPHLYLGPGRNELCNAILCIRLAFVFDGDILVGGPYLGFVDSMTF